MWTTTRLPPVTAAPDAGAPRPCAPGPAAPGDAAGRDTDGQAAPRILIVLAPPDAAAGGRAEEFADAYCVFADAGAAITFASPHGGPQPPAASAATGAARRLAADPDARAALARTASLAGLRTSDYDALFYPGGHGLPSVPAPDASPPAPPSAAAPPPAAARPPAAPPPAHPRQAPVVFSHARAADGTPLVLRGPPAASPAAILPPAILPPAILPPAILPPVILPTVVPFLAGHPPGRCGGAFRRPPDWQPHVVLDPDRGPASPRATAHALLDLLARPAPDRPTAATGRALPRKDPAP